METLLTAIVILGATWSAVTLVQVRGLSVELLRVRALKNNNQRSTDKG